MENISKALLIAGATLIAIMIISLAMWFLSALGEYGNKQAFQTKQTEIESYNRYFYYSIPEVGDRITGADFINLAKKARELNKDEDTYFITIDSFDGNLSTMTDVAFNNYVASKNDNFLLTSNINYSVNYDGITGRINRLVFTH